MSAVPIDALFLSRQTDLSPVPGIGVQPHPENLFDNSFRRRLGVQTPKSASNHEDASTMSGKHISGDSDGRDEVNNATTPSSLDEIPTEVWDRTFPCRHHTAELKQGGEVLLGYLPTGKVQLA